MAEQTDNTMAAIHTLFKLFHEYDVPHKRDMCEELRVLILDKKVSGKAPISSLANNSEVMNACTKRFRDAVHEVIQYLNPEHMEQNQSDEDEEEDDDEEMDPDYVPPGNLAQYMLPPANMVNKLKTDNMMYISKNIKEIGDRLEQYARLGEYNQVKFIVKYLEMTARVLDAINDN